MPGALIVRTRRGRPFTKDILAKDIRQVREKLGIPSELKLADLRRTAWTEMANKGATVPELAASAGLVNGHRSKEHGDLCGHFWTPCRRRPWTPGKEHKRDRKVKKVKSRWFFSKKKSKVWRE